MRKFGIRIDFGKLLDEKRAIGPQRDIREVKNAFKVYDDLSSYHPFSLDALLKAHRALMQGLVPDPGAFRRQAIGLTKRKVCG